MKQKSILFLGLLIFWLCTVQAAQVDTLLVESPSMNKKVKVVVIVPEVARGVEGEACPVVYLLHGYSGNAFSWLAIKPDLPQIADEKGLILVCPDGQNSWYWDSPKKTDYCYETFISSELLRYIDTHYRSIADRKGRAITGLSMGGHGALYNALRHKDRFGAAGSTSGGVDIRPFPQSWEMSSQLGSYESNPKVWDEHTVVNQLDGLSNGELALIIDCGVDDFFLEVNKALNGLLLSQKIDHDFILRPGAHNPAYWANSIDYQLLFFEKFFKRSSEEH